MTAYDRLLLPWLGLNAQGDVGGYTMYQSARGHRVYYPKAPPLNPASQAQLTMRNKYRLCGYLWRNLPPARRENWLLAARRAGLRITGYNLWVYWQTKTDEPAIRTIERQTNLQLLD